MMSIHPFKLFHLIFLQFFTTRKYEYMYITYNVTSNNQNFNNKNEFIQLISFIVLESHITNYAFDLQERLSIN